MRTSLILSTALFSVVAAVGPTVANNYTQNSSSRLAAAAAPKSTCETLLDNSSFSCHVKNSFGGDFTDCFEFFSPGTASSHFDLVVTGYNPFLHMGCACGATGSVKKPQFNVSSNFVCDSGDGFNFAGKVSGKGSKTKISKGFAESLVGDTFVYDCTLSPTPCGASPSGAFVDGSVNY
jgi:hypothetical protein